MRDKLIEISELADMLGFTDLRTIKKWCIKNNLPLMTLGKNTFTLTFFLNLFLENELKNFLTQNFENAEEILEAVKNDAKIELAKLLKAPFSTKVLSEFNDSKNRSKASENFLKNIKRA